MSTRSKRSSTAGASSRGRKRKSSGDGNSTDTMCRICMRWDSPSSMVDLFDRMTTTGQEEGMKLAEFLELIGSVQISENDRLPKLCCTRCRKDLERAYRLRMLCQDSDRKLRELFPDVEVTVVKVEPPDTGEANPLEVVCKPDVDEVFEEEVESGVGDRIEFTTSGRLEDLVQPKLEIEADEGDGDDAIVEDISNEMADDGTTVESDEEEDVPKKKRRKKREKQPKEKNESEFKDDVYEKIPAVGFRCCGCKIIFETSKELHAHSQAVHAENKQSASQLHKKVQCDICYKVMTRPKVLSKHNNLREVNYRCKSCGEIFWSRKRVCFHFSNLHGPNPTVSGLTRICCACAKKFETDEQLKEHCDAVHLPEKPPPDPNRPFVCNICHRRFQNDLLLYAHQTRMIKNAKKKHICSECGKTFRQPGALRDHEISHSGEKVFKCPHCPAAYSNRDSLRGHIQDHSQAADKYKCEVCGLCFRNTTGLKEHALVHTGERPLLCPHCPANFARPSCLKAHLQTHTGERNFKCPLCDKGFPRASECQKHVKFVHEKLKPFPCFFCPKSYPRKDYRKRHMVSAHPDELRDNLLPEIELSGNARRFNNVLQNDISQSLLSSTYLPESVPSSV